MGRPLAPAVCHQSTTAGSSARVACRPGVLPPLHRSRVLTRDRLTPYNRSLFAPRTPLNRPVGHAYQAAINTVGLWRKKGGPSAASRKDANEGHFDLQQ